MSAASPTAFSLWAILSLLFLIFLVHHLWCYDRFKCLRWSAGQHGAFKRVMTYSYLGAVPLLAVYSVGMTVIKYREGFAVLPDGTILPIPINDYRDANKSWVLPLQFVFSFAWALEITGIWLYLLHQNPEKEAWFSSWEYRLWYMGSLVAIIGMPLTALITRRNLETCDAYIFLVGASGSTSTTIAFLYVLWRFPRFIQHVKAEGADPTVVVRLATFYNLNQVRVVFRFMFTFPLLVLALDGIVGTEHIINRNLFATDFLQMFAGLGCFVSSMITLLIFFPRSIVREAGYKPKVSSTLAHSPKSPPITPPLRAPYPYPSPPPHHQHHHLPPHMAGYATPNGLRMSVTGGTGWTGSLRGARTLRYTEEDDGMQRRRSRKSMRGSRRVSVYSGTMDAHMEGESDEGDDPRPGMATSAEGDVEDTERGDEERAPPYSHTQSHRPPHSPHPPQTPAPSPLPQVHLHQRHPFPQSLSSPQIVTLPSPSPHEPPPPPSPDPPQARLSSSSPQQQARPSSPKRQMDWEERRPLRGEAEARRSLHVITTAPGVNIGLGLVSTALGGGRGPGAVAGAGPGGTVPAAGPMGRAAAGSNLHPYVVNFTSPIDLVDLPPRDELPRAI
ncbi:hypothetical protein C8T65DRAFT_745676 [Cerioporus squamosus]|nr:hypothetical protein C8T65DRAFT_745676 [Cerioporus squamosus]